MSTDKDMSEEQFHRQSITFHKMHASLRTEVDDRLTELERSLGPLKAAHAQRRVMRDQIKTLFKRVESLECRLAVIEGIHETRELRRKAGHPVV